MCFFGVGFRFVILGSEAIKDAYSGGQTLNSRPCPRSDVTGSCARDEGATGDDPSQVWLWRFGYPNNGM